MPYTVAELAAELLTAEKNMVSKNSPTCLVNRKIRPKIFGYSNADGETKLCRMSYRVLAMNCAGRKIG